MMKSFAEHRRARGVQAGTNVGEVAAFMKPGASAQLRGPRAHHPDLHQPAQDEGRVPPCEVPGR